MQGLLKWVFRGFAAIGVATVLTATLLAVFYFSRDEYSGAEEKAVPTQSHPLAGFYKSESCEDPWGWAIGPANDTEYYISFCGPGGCFEEGTYRPNTTIYDDPKYEVVDENTINFLSQGIWTAHKRCPSRT